MSKTRRTKNNLALCLKQKRKKRKTKKYRGGGKPGTDIATAADIATATATATAPRNKLDAFFDRHELRPPTDVELEQIFELSTLFRTVDDVRRFYTKFDKELKMLKDLVYCTSELFSKILSRLSRGEGEDILNFMLQNEGAFCDGCISEHVDLILLPKYVATANLKIVKFLWNNANINRSDADDVAEELGTKLYANVCKTTSLPKLLQYDGIADYFLSDASIAYNAHVLFEVAKAVIAQKATTVSDADVDAVDAVTISAAPVDRELKYVVFCNKDRVEDVNDIGANICLSLQQKKNYTSIFGNITMQTMYMSAKTQMKVLKIHPNTFFVLPLSFCNTLKDEKTSIMDQSFLFNSIDAQTKFVLISYYAIEDVHSVMTFHIHEDKKDALSAFHLKIDAICVNNVKKYAGAGKMIKDLISVCSLEPSSKVNRVTEIKLHALNNEKTLDFYHRLNFTKTPDTDPDDFQKQFVLPHDTSSALDNTEVQQLILDIASVHPETVAIENDTCSTNVTKSHTEGTLIGGMLTCEFDVVIKIQNSSDNGVDGRSFYRSTRYPGSDDAVGGNNTRRKKKTNKRR